METIHEIAQLVIERIKQDYYLVPRKIIIEKFDRHEFMNNIMNFVSDYTGMGLESIKSPLRTRELVEARSIILFISEKHSTEIIDKQYIGALLNRDRSTIHQAIAQTHSLMTGSRTFKIKVEQCTAAYLEQFGK